MARVLIQRQVVDNVASLIIDGRLHEGDTVRIDVGPDDRLFAVRDDEAGDRAAAAVPMDDEPIEPDSME